MLQPPLSSKFLILCLLVYLFSASWINQEENLAEKQKFYLCHFIIFDSSPTPFLLFQLRTLELLFFYLLLCFLYLFFGSAACGTFTSQPGIKPASPALEVRSLNHSRDSQGSPTLGMLLIFASYTLYGQIIPMLIHKHL